METIYRTGFATCNPACTCDDRRMCNTIDHCCGSGRNFTGRFRDLNTGSTGDVGTDDITAIVSIYKTKNFRIGSALPVMMGISFAYVPSMQAIASDFDIATILGAQIIGGVVALLVGLNIKRIRKFFPPLITGTVVFPSVFLCIRQQLIIWPEVRAARLMDHGRIGWLRLLH